MPETVSGKTSGFMGHKKSPHALDDTSESAWCLPSTTILLVTRAKQVITISMFHDRSCAWELDRTCVASSDHLAQEPGPFYPHPLLFATCTALRVIPVVLNECGHSG